MTPRSIQLYQPKKLNLPLLLTFDENAFKKSFLIPQLNASKKKKNLPKEKQSTVITSEAWRESELKKLEEKQRLDDEKAARKIQREQNKVLAAQMKFDKEKAKEKKKQEKEEKLAQKEAEKEEKLARKEAEKEEKLIQKGKVRKTAKRVNKKKSL